MKQAGIAILIIFMSVLSSFGQEYFVNGGFEHGRDVYWTHHCGTNDNASFYLSNDAPMEGRQQLAVTVTKKSNDPSAITSSTEVTLSGDSIYLLRFWAHGKERTKIKVSIIGESTISVVYEMRPGRILFHLPFKTFDKEITVKISYLEKATYYLDGFEILNQNNEKNVDVLNTYIWNNMQVDPGSWVAGDNDVSYKLPDGRTLWFFNDSFIASSNDTTNNPLYNAGSFVRNAMVVEDTDGKLYTRPYINQNGQSVYFLVQDSILNDNGSLNNFYWVGDALMEDGKVKVYLVELLTTSNGAAASGRSYLAEFSYPELEYLGTYEQAEFCYGYESFFIENDTIYLYRGTGEGFSRYMHVARTPLGNMMGYEPWEYWNGTAWTGDESEQAVLLDMDPSGVIRLEEGSYAAVSLPVMGDEIKVSFAPDPEGPWTPKQTVYDIPHDSAYWWYMPNIHNQLPNGKYSVSYSTNAWYDLFFSFESFEDKYWYRPRYIQVDLLGLSPYSQGTDCAGITGGSAYLDNCGNCVGGTTGKVACVEGTARLYSECDFAGPGIGLEAGSYTLDQLSEAGYEDNTISSLSISSGYQIELFDDNNFSGNSVLLNTSVSCLDNESFNDLTSSVRIQRTGTEDISGTFVIQNAATGLSMVPATTDPVNSTTVLQDHYYGTENQQFEIAYLGNYLYTIKNKGCDKYLDITLGEKSWKRSATVWDGLVADFTEFMGDVYARYNDSPSGKGAMNLIDNNYTSTFMTYHAITWLKYHYDVPFVATAYTLTSSADDASNDPKYWAFRGSNDGVNWITLDTLSDQSFAERNMTRKFSISNTDAYSYYKLDIISGSTAALELNEWEILYDTPVEGGYDSYKFIIQDAGDGNYRLINAGSDLVLEIVDSKTETGIAVQQMPDYNQSSGLWKLLDPATVQIYTTVAEHKMSREAILVYPNPAGDFIRIQAADEFKGGDFRICSVTGSVVLEGRFEGSLLDISMLQSGFYLVELRKDGVSAVTRFIRQ